MRNATVIALATAALFAGGAEASAAASPPCRVSGGTLVKAGSEAAVYRRGSRHFGCHRDARPVLMSNDSVRLVRIAGRYAAFVNGSAESEEVLVWDLAARPRTRRATVIGSAQASCEGSCTTDLELAPTMAVAWIEFRPTEVGDRRIEVRKYDGDGRNRLDFGDGISTNSLRRRRSTVSWLHDGERRSYTLASGRRRVY
jgi:hypothetical protein